jgi:hypothetical protein
MSTADGDTTMEGGGADNDVDMAQTEEVNKIFDY